MKYVSSSITDRLPETDDEGRVSPDDCYVVNVGLMLPPDTTTDDVELLMRRVYDAEPSILYWSTNLIRKRSDGSN